MTQTVTQNLRLRPSGPSKLLKIMVGTTGFEPATSSVSRKRSNQLSYAPVKATRISLSGSGRLRQTVVPGAEPMLYHHYSKAEHGSHADGACAWAHAIGRARICA